MRKILLEQHAGTISSQGVRLVKAKTPCTRGHTSLRYETFGGCVECVRENNAKNRVRNSVTVKTCFKRWCQENREYCNKWRRDWNAANPNKRVLSMSKKVAEYKRLPFDLALDDINIPTHCPILGMPMFLGKGKRTDNSPSLDRIIPKLGYVKGNVIVISWRANRIKNDATVEELEKIAAFYKQHLCSKD